jgi:hypothetical protein
VPAWSILIATLAYRQEKLRRLLGVLLPQADQAPGQVEVVALRNTGEWSIGEIRQALLEDARGAYVSFVDDDDLVEPDFVPAVLAAMESGPDYIAFRHAYYEGGVFDRETVTGIQHGGWFNTPGCYVRDVTHVNPVLTGLARRAGFSDMGSGEDVAYADRLRPLLRSQAEIDRVLYRYFHDWSGSVQAGLPPQVFLRRYRHLCRLPVDSPSFRWHDWSTGPAGYTWSGAHAETV